MDNCAMKLLLVLLLSLVPALRSLENGLARTPPMGWMSWTKFYCEVDCDRHPFSCINEDLYKSHADRLALDGYLEAGYEYIHIDDCYLAKQRNGDGKLEANSTRFPSGVKGLADYIHSLGLKFAVYEDYGTTTCAGYPGSLNHLQTDAETFKEWGADYLKLDGCNVDVDKMKTGYPEMTKYLNQTGRPIVYSCSWPAYLIDQPQKVDYMVIAEYCNLWRNFDDIERSWTSIKKIIDYYNANQDKMIPAHGPGHWNDPDMIVVGNTELSINQSKAQMTIWAIWSAPLIMSNDLRTITPEYKEILLNRRVIEVNQDPLGVMGRMIYNDSMTYVYVKKMTPVDTARGEYSYAVAILNHADYAIDFETDLASIGLSNRDGYDLVDLWSGEKLGHFAPSSVYSARLSPTSVVFFKATLPNLKKHVQRVERRRKQAYH